MTQHVETERNRPSPVSRGRFLLYDGAVAVVLWYPKPETSLYTYARSCTARVHPKVPHPGGRGSDKVHSSQCPFSRVRRKRPR